MATPAQGLTLVSTQEILEALIKLPEYVPPHNSLAYGLMPDGTPYATASRADQLDAIHKALAGIYTYETRCEDIGQKLGNLPPVPHWKTVLEYGI